MRRPDNRKSLQRELCIITAYCISQREATHLEAEDGQDGLSVDEGGVAEVVEATRREDLSTCLEPDSLAKLDAVLGEDLGSDAAEGAKHGPAGVDHLDLAVTLEGLGVSRETSGVPAVVTRVLAGEVWWGGIVGEGPEPLGAVGAVELDGSAGDDAPLHDHAEVS
jgi:hypothetical protein